jgi:hypothetical protein
MNSPETKVKSDPSPCLSIQHYGVNIQLTTHDPKLVAHVHDELMLVLPGFRQVQSEAEHHLFHRLTASGQNEVFYNSELEFITSSWNELLSKLVSKIRMVIAEFAVGYVFIHSGAVSIGDNAILLPGNSFDGKSTLTAELVRQGSAYLSDEYGILDETGCVHPVTSHLTLRHEDNTIQTGRSVKSIGGTTAETRAKVKMVVFTKYYPNAEWIPKRLSRPNGIMEIINHVIPIRRSPIFALSALGQMANSSIFFASHRGEAKYCAEKILQLFEKDALMSAG